MYIPGSFGAGQLKLTGPGNSLVISSTPPTPAGQFAGAQALLATATAVFGKQASTAQFCAQSLARTQPAR